MEEKSKKKILVVDNDRITVDVIADILNDLPLAANVHGAADVEQARVLFTSEKYDAVLVNIDLKSLADIDSADFVKYILVLSRYGGGPNIKVVVISENKNGMEKAIRLGAHLTLLKPLDREELKEKISEILK